MDVRNISWAFKIDSNDRLFVVELVTGYYSATSDGLFVVELVTGYCSGTSDGLFVVELVTGYL